MDKPVYKFFTVTPFDQKRPEDVLNEYYEEGYRVDTMTTNRHVYPEGTDLATHPIVFHYHIVMKLKDSD